MSGIRKIADIVKPSAFLDYKNWLLSLYLKANDELGVYSYATLASDLGFSANNIILHFVKGRRPLTQKSAKKIAASLKLSKFETQFLLELVKYNTAKKSDEQKKAFERLTELKTRSMATTIDKLRIEFFSKWYHSAIAELVRLDDFESDPHRISNALHGTVRPEQVKKSLKLLESLNLITLENDRYVRTDKDPSTPNQVVGLSVSNYHMQMMTLAQQAMGKIDKERRGISSLTLVADDVFVEKLKVMVEEFQSSVLEMEKKVEKPDKVIQLNSQLFPLSKTIKK